MTGNKNCFEKLDLEMLEAANRELLAFSKWICSPSKFNIQVKNIGLVEFFTNSAQDKEVSVCINKNKEMSISDFKSFLKL